MSEEVNKGGFKASEELLLLLEGAKTQLDQSVDRLPGIYFIANARGDVFRSNHALQAVLGVNNSQGLNIFDRIENSDLSRLQELMSLAVDDPLATFDLEVELHVDQNEIANFSLVFYSWSVDGNPNVPYFTFHGRDISTLKRVTQEKNKLQQEVVIAEKVQGLMLPKQNFEFGGGRISCFYDSASECGGDFLYYNKFEDTLRVWAGDVTGHGVGSAMISGAIRAAVAMIEFDNQSTTPNRAIESLNSTLLSISGGEYWMTFHVVDFDFKQGKVRMCQAGHTEIFAIPLAQLKKGDWKCFEIKTPDPSSPLGVSPNSNFMNLEFDLKPSMLYMSFSDGLIETVNDQGKEYGRRRLLKCFSTSYAASYSIEDARKAVLEDVAAFRSYGPKEDDLSMWMVETGEI